MTKKTDEERGRYDAEAEVAEALSMLGSGYEPSVEISRPHTTIIRDGGEFQEVEKPAFVKISTSFKGELKKLSGDALKVWLFIALSINRKTAQAHPGLRTIAENVDLAVNTVQKTLKELEDLSLLNVIRGEKRFNLYEVPEYVSANRAEPTVSNGDTDGKTVSNGDTSVSKSSKTVSPSVILNQRNQKNQKKAAAPKEPTPPEVTLFREVTKRFPSKVNFEDVVESVSKVRERLGREVSKDDLLPFYRKWCGLGYKPVNLAWLEWAEAGQIPKNGNWKSRRENSQLKPVEIAAEKLEELRRQAEQLFAEDLKVRT